MKEKKLSLNNVISNSVEALKGNYKRVIAVSIMQYMIFLITYLLTYSFMISFAVYALFVPSTFLFLSDLQNAKAEWVFKIGKSLATAILISFLFVFVFGVGLVLLIFPAVIFFANYGLVFEEAKNGDKDVLAAFKSAKERVKGYRGKMALLCLTFLLLLILFVGFGILIAWLFSLFMPALTIYSSFIFSFVNIPLFYYIGSFLGISLFLIFVMPFGFVTVSKMKEAIEQDRLHQEELKQQEPKEENEAPKVIELGQEKVEEQPEKKEDDNPPDYIS